MSTRITHYLIYGFKLDGKFTEEYLDSENYDKHEFDDKKDNQPCFLSDGMNCEYTYFGFIADLDLEEAIELEISFNKEDIISRFKELYPSVTIPEIKRILLPHWT